VVRKRRFGVEWTDARRRSLCFNMDGNGKPFSSDITVCLSETITFLRWLLRYGWTSVSLSVVTILDTEMTVVSAFRNIIWRLRSFFWRFFKSPLALSDLPILWREAFLTICTCKMVSNNANSTHKLLATLFHWTINCHMIF
jgi:hypothetical protein